jgi:purine-nucleoside phosphorylase
MIEATPHIEVTEEGLIAKTVLMPGDPLRAKFIAENFLEDVVQFNSVRGMLGFTGTYKGHKVSVMGSGMGMPSIGIYSYELFNVYGVERIIRIGSAGAYDAKCKVYDVVVVEDAYSESNYAKLQNGETKNHLSATKELTDTILTTAKEQKIDVHFGTIHSSDVFYGTDKDLWKRLNKEEGCLGVEMESFALFHNANHLGKSAACILTISDSFITHEVTTSHERQVAFATMMRLALETAIKY